MIITKADIGRKAVARDGEILTLNSFIPNEPNYPYHFIDSQGDWYTYTETGLIFDGHECNNDIIRWADETEDAQ
jgi:hypothetical protein